MWEPVSFVLRLAGACMRSGGPLWGHLSDVR
jgi:hypothetical protein